MLGRPRARRVGAKVIPRVIVPPSIVGEPTARLDAACAGLYAWRSDKRCAYVPCDVAAAG